MPFKIDQYNENISNYCLNQYKNYSQIIWIIIGNSLSKFTLEQIYLKLIRECDPLDFNNYSSPTHILNQDFPFFEIKLPHEVKIKFVDQIFQKRNNCDILGEKLQFKYSKLYKIQFLFVLKNQHPPILGLQVNLKLYIGKFSIQKFRNI